ncbi:amidohydrolase family protein [Paenibacillus sp. TRM 82003]|uniref:metal-dependent hydrolase family protein n=1 Tax=Kineococcus sp. TRM81007 TaxID=2925831 RepID=UPI001F57B72A|nr:amidohydrolase family protein [Kineococcus sp. TRM81007]MCI2239042.1 amidohydrolase family protein [Kineococcus sp. TRM81007]MCI3924462.1 amidohydrolase family protein [Paenibacillus sp. TRM 82003]
MSPDESLGADGRFAHLIITDALVHDGGLGEPFEADVVVSAGRIVAVGAGAGRDRSAAQVLPAQGRSLLPGLIDAHFHAYATTLDAWQLETQRLSYAALVGAQRLGRALRRGFTTVRDVAGGDEGLERACREGLLPAPRYLWTGPAMSQTGGHGDPRPGEVSVCFHGGPMNEVVDGVEALRVATRDRFRRGAHAVKIMTSGGVVSPTDPIRVPQYSAEEVAAVCGEARRRGSYVAAHAYSPEAVLHSVRSGVRSIEHGNLLDAEAASAMATAGAFLVPTLAAYDAMARRHAEVGLSPVQRAKNTEVLEAGKAAVDTARSAGVPIGFGSDLMAQLEDDQLRGLQLQAEVLGVDQTIHSATRVNARLLERADLGTIAAGAVADLLLLDGRLPQEGSLLWNGQRPRTVVQGGRVL